MKIHFLLACSIIVSFAAMPFAFAETATTAAGAAATATTATDDAKAAKAAKAKECISEADAKGLHGKERKKFKSHCKHAK